MNNVAKGHIAAFFLGASVASAAVSALYSFHFMKNERVLLGVVHVHEHLSALDALRRNDSEEALGKLEFQLSRSLQMLDRDLGVAIDGPPAKVLKRAAEYRALHPAKGTGSPLLDAQEMRVLSVAARSGV